MAWRDYSEFKDGMEVFERDFKAEAQEILAVFCLSSGSMVRVGWDNDWDNLYMASALLLAWQDCETGEVHRGDGRVCWPLTIGEARRHDLGYPFFFETGTVYRLRVQDCSFRDAYPERGESFGNRFHVLEAIQSGVVNGALEEVWRNYAKPLVLVHPLLGDFAMNEEFCSLEGSLKWLGREVLVCLDIDTGLEEEEAKATPEALECLKTFLVNQETKDIEMRSYAAGEFARLANEFSGNNRECSGGAAIAEEDFARRLSLLHVSIAPDGSGYAVYHADGMLYDHDVGVGCDINGNLEDADFL